MATRTYSAKKQKFYQSLSTLLDDHERIIIVHADHVGSKQMADIRHALRGKAVLLMGKNTTVRKLIREKMADRPDLESLLALVRSNIGFAFCIIDPIEVRKVILDFKVPAPARQGAIAPIDVWIKAGPTGLDAGNTSYFQSLGIATKIVKLQIEIQSDVQVCTCGDKVTASAAHLLQKLDIKPFSYGLVTQTVWNNGSSYDCKILDLSDDDIIAKFQTGVTMCAALSRAIGYPTQASLSHCVVEAYRMCLALASSTDAGEV